MDLPTSITYLSTEAQLDESATRVQTAPGLKIQALNTRLQDQHREVPLVWADSSVEQAFFRGELCMQSLKYGDFT
jgi:hypothetical protein